MYQELERTCTAIVLLIKPFAFCDIAVTVSLKIECKLLEPSASQTT